VGQNDRNKSDSVEIGKHYNNRLGPLLREAGAGGSNPLTPTINLSEYEILRHRPNRTVLYGVSRLSNEGCIDHYNPLYRLRTFRNQLIGLKLI